MDFQHSSTHIHTYISYTKNCVKTSEKNENDLPERPDKIFCKSLNWIELDAAAAAAVAAGVGVVLAGVEEDWVVLAVVLLEGWVVVAVVVVSAKLWDSEFEDADWPLEGLLVPKMLLKLGMPLIPPTLPENKESELQKMENYQLTTNTYHL